MDNGTARRRGEKEKQTRIKKKKTAKSAFPKEQLSVIKALTASDSNTAPFCFGPITVLTGIQNGPGCHIKR